MDRDLRCPRCDSQIGMDDEKCPNCRFMLRRKEGSTTGSTGPTGRRWIPWKKGVSFVGLPRFLREDRPDFSVPEAQIAKSGWKAVFALLAAAGILFAYRTPVLEIWRNMLSGSGENGGSVEIQVMPSKTTPSRRSAPPVRRENRAPRREVPSSKRVGSSSVAQDAGLEIKAHRGSLLVTGQVFDLWTLEPIASAALIFHSATGDRYFATSTVADGEFGIELPSAALEDGFYLKARLNGYIDRPLERTEAQAGDLKKLHKEDRKDIGREFQRTIVPAEPVQPKGERKTMILFLVPDEDR